MTTKQKQKKKNLKKKVLRALMLSTLLLAEAAPLMSATVQASVPRVPGQTLVNEKGSAESLSGPDGPSTRVYIAEHSPPRMKWAPTLVPSGATEVFAYGDGSIEDPYQISTAAQLDAVRADLTAHYALTADIDLSEYENWLPIGSNMDKFAGSLDGRNHTISNLTLSASESQNDGLFGAIGSTAVLSNVHLADVAVEADHSVGALVGASAGLIENCSVEGGLVTGNMIVGGLVGHQEDGEIRSSHANIRVEGLGRIGGLVGSVASGVSVIESYAQGDVTGEMRVGGLVGELSGSISRSMASGAVNGQGSVGGLVGYSAGSIRNAYFAGPHIEGADSAIGGIAGEVASGDLQNVFAVTSVIGGDFVGGIVGTTFSDVSLVNTLFIGDIVSSESAGAISEASDLSGHGHFRWDGTTLNGAILADELAENGVAVTADVLQNQSAFEDLGVDFDGTWVWDSVIKFPNLDLGNDFRPILPWYHQLSGKQATEEYSRKRISLAELFEVRGTASLEDYDFELAEGAPEDAKISEDGYLEFDKIGDFTVVATRKVPKAGFETEVTTRLTVTPKKVNWANQGQVEDRVYDGTMEASLDVLPELEEGFLVENVLGLPDEVRLTAGSVFFESSQVGQQTVLVDPESPWTLIGTHAENYELVQPGFNSAEITPRPITFTGSVSAEKIYDGTADFDENHILIDDPSAFDNVIPGDEVLKSAAGLTGVHSGGAAVGVGFLELRSRNGFTLTGADAHNYTLEGTPIILAQILNAPAGDYPDYEGQMPPEQPNSGADGPIYYPNQETEGDIKEELLDLEGVEDLPTEHQAAQEVAAGVESTESTMPNPLLVGVLSMLGLGGAAGASAFAYKRWPRRKK